VPASITLPTVEKQRNGVFWHSLPRGYNWENLLDSSSVQFVKRPFFLMAKRDCLERECSCADFVSCKTAVAKA
jgi:hypothetical protein